MDKTAVVVIIILVLFVLFLGIQVLNKNTSGEAITGSYAQNIPSQFGGGGCGR